MKVYSIFNAPGAKKVHMTHKSSISSLMLKSPKAFIYLDYLDSLDYKRLCFSLGIVVLHRYFMFAL